MSFRIPQRMNKNESENKPRGPNQTLLRENQNDARTQSGQESEAPQEQRVTLSSQRALQSGTKQQEHGNVTHEMRKVRVSEHVPDQSNVPARTEKVRYAHGLEAKQ